MIVNQTALATIALTDMMYQLFCYNNDMRVYKGFQQQGGSSRHWYSFDRANSDKWNQMMLVDDAVESMLKNGGSIIAVGLFCQWVTEVFSSEVIIKRSNFKLQQTKTLLESKAEFERNFDRELAATEFNADILVPRGHVHYRYVYRWAHKAGYTPVRERVLDINDTYWSECEYWFDYFGPDEDDVGLIYYLDYE
ncbi:hypothetical protein [Shewanella morhuae]|uniref:Uncharacterized protein n=1 Tax=Shewanella morhuae TaxID=365591 RepID=A0A380BWM8_9GAMM|nr:hypothetical protein [Shewanella morhuae]SUJ08597.1 Uncharacterised protein [Shewanella morhuae]